MDGEEEEGEGEEGGGEGGGGEHVGDVGTLRGVQLCLLSPLLPIHSGAGSANQFNAKEKEIKQKHILKANIYRCTQIAREHSYFIFVNVGTPPHYLGL